jgi:hypothetical protein
MRCVSFFPGRYAEEVERDEGEMGHFAPRTHLLELINGANLTDYGRNGFSVKKIWLNGLDVQPNFLVACVSNASFLMACMSKSRVFDVLPDRRPILLSVF